MDRLNLPANQPQQPVRTLRYDEHRTWRVQTSMTIRTHFLCDLYVLLFN